MAISFVNSAQVTGTSITLPSDIQAGDYILVYSYKTTTTAPGLPSGYTSISTQSANTNSERMSYKVATGSESGTSITSSNASNIHVVVYRGVGAIGAASSTTNASSGVTTVPGIATFANKYGPSWVVSAAGSKQSNTMDDIPETTTRGTAQVGTGHMSIIGDTNGDVYSWPQRSVTLGTGATGAGASVELIPPPPTGTIAFDNASSSANASFTHATGSGNNRLMIVVVSMRNVVPMPTVNYVRYGSTDLTKLTDKIVTGYTNNDIYLEAWYLVNPPNANSTVTINYSATPTRRGHGAITYTGVDQADPFSAFNSQIGGTSPLASTVTPDNANTVPLTLAVIRDTVLPTWLPFDNNRVYATGGTSHEVLAIERPMHANSGAPATFSNAMSSNEWATITLALNPHVASGSTGQMKVYNGTDWTPKPVKVWDGSTWTAKPVKRWDGTAWVTTPY